MATGQGRGFNSVSKDLSGAVAVGLYMKQSGQARSMRRCIADTLFHGVDNVIDAPPLEPHHESRIFLDGLLCLCLPNSECGRSRHEQLMEELSGDVRQDAIVLRVPGSGADGFDLTTWLRGWAARVARLLLPCAISVFPNHRWVNSLGTLSELSLLGGVHNVLTKAGCKWLSGVPLSDTCGRPATRQSNGCAWDILLSDSDDEDVVKDDPVASAAVQALVKQQAAGALATVLATLPEQNPWVAINNKHKKTAWQWFLSNPRDRLLAARISMTLSVHMLRLVEHIAAERWQTMQFKHMMDTGQFRCRMTAVQDLKPTMEQRVRELLTVPGKWEPIRPVARTLGLASLCFTMFMSTACAYEQMCLSWIAGAPYLLWELLHKPSRELAQRILALSKALCLCDEFTRHFLKRFSTEAALLSHRCKACLICIGLLVHWEIVRIECRHALSRRWALAHQTVGIDVQQLSGKHILHRHAVLESFLSRQPRALKIRGRRFSRPKKKSGQRRGFTPGKGKGQTSGGGGAWRAHQSKCHAGNKFRSEQERSQAFIDASASYARIKAEGGAEWNRLVELGEAGCASFKSGGMAFGGSKKRSVPSSDVAVPSAKLPRRDDITAIVAVDGRSRLDEVFVVFVLFSCWLFILSYFELLRSCIPMSSLYFTL